MTDFYSGDPGDENVEREDRIADALKGLRCAYSKCNERVDPNSYCYPYCIQCYAERECN
jgi:hypothetical protein